MIEAALALLIVALAALGLGLGQFFGRPPIRSSCDASACLPEGRCADCPLRRRAPTTEDTP